MATANTTSWTRRHYFLLRRLHSLTGIIPVGVFLIFHLSINASILAGGDSFQAAVDQLHLLERFGWLTVVEFGFIFIPLAFHAVLGVVIWLSGRMNVAAHPYGGNIRYTIQRITGLIAFAFILFHLWHVHWLGRPFAGGVFEPHEAASSAAAALAPIWIRLIYAVGITAAVFHLANGIWTFLITWGVSAGVRAHRWTGVACTLFGIALGIVGLGALFGFGRFKIPEQPAELSGEHATLSMTIQPETTQLADGRTG